MRINIEMSKLADGLSFPEDISSLKADLISEAPLQLLSNPYFKVGKKKKKKGKKKKWMSEEFEILQVFYILFA